MHPAEDNNDVFQDERSLIAAQQLVAYEEAKAADFNLSDSQPIEPALRERLASELACVDLLHRVWPDFGPPSPVISEQSPPRTLGDFRLIRELGSGGMGRVYEAEQISMGRRVALKVLPFAALVQDKSLQRFRNEVRAAAALDHPHIVSIYSVGEDRGVHFFAMQLIRGQTLADVIAQLRIAAQPKSPAADSSFDQQLLTMDGVPADKQSRENAPAKHSAGGLSPSTTRELRVGISTDGESRHAAEFYRTAARLGVQASEALQHAHDLGVLHRDIKPSNLMLDAEGQLYIMDFGLARIEADVGVTMTGDIVGTLRYMAPEQALAKRVVIDHRADIYSLGATLYELLTLQPAFGGTDRGELLKQIAFEEPRPLRKLNHHIPIELETIVLKAMAKLPEDRYEVSQRLADDLRAFLEHRPITARPASIADRVLKWSRRHRTVVRTAGLALVLCIGLLIVSTVLVKRAQVQALAALEKTSDLLYTSDMSVAYQTLEKGWPDEVQTILDRYQPIGRDPDRRGLEWHLLQKLAQQPESIALAGHDGAVNEMAVFPDRRRLASVGQDGTLRIWDVRAGKLLRTITICDEELHSVAISPDGRFVAAGSKAVYLYDLEGTDQATARFHSKATIESLAFSADGKHLAAGARYQDVCLLSLEGKVEKQVPCASRVESLEYVTGTSLLLVPNRRLTAAKQQLGVIQLWGDSLTKVEQVLAGSRPHRPAQISIARSSPCGKFVVAGEGYNSRARLFELATGRVLAETPVSRDILTDLAYSPDGNAIAIGYGNGLVEYFDVKLEVNGKTSLNRRGLVVSAHLGDVKSLRIVDEKILASCGIDGFVRIWKMPNDAAQNLELTDSTLFDLKLSPDGSLLLYVGHNEFLIANVDNGEVVCRRSHAEANYGESAWSPTGDKAAVCCGDTASVDILGRSGRVLYSISYGARPEAVVFSANGSFVAIVGGQELQLCHSDNGREVLRYSLSQPAENVAFSPDGFRLAYGGSSGTVVIFNIAERQPMGELACGRPARCLAFSPDGAMLATGHADSVIRLWDVQSEKLRAELAGHEREVTDLAFSPDGRTLLSSSSDGSIRVWSTDHARGYGIVYRRFASGTSDALCQLSLSSDGRRLVAGYATQRKDCPDVLLWRLDASARSSHIK